MSSRKMTQEEIEIWKKAYAKDLAVIGPFLKQCSINRTITYRLFFKDGTQLIADLNAYGDSDNDLELDDPYYEDLYEFYFIVKKIEKKGTELNYKENEGIALNYHNFFVKFESFEG